MAYNNKYTQFIQLRKAEIQFAKTVNGSKLELRFHVAKTYHAPGKADAEDT